MGCSESHDAPHSSRGPPHSPEAELQLRFERQHRARALAHTGSSRPGAADCGSGLLAPFVPLAQPSSHASPPGSMREHPCHPLVLSPTNMTPPQSAASSTGSSAQAGSPHHGTRRSQEVSSQPAESSLPRRPHAQHQGCPLSPAGLHATPSSTFDSSPTPQWGGVATAVPSPACFGRDRSSSFVAGASELTVGAPAV
uniref:Uncharacterized protein n=1 Tax=Neobodo designis TaxID=312471 RepID=A0A7S1LDY2_NEODS